MATIHNMYVLRINHAGSLRSAGRVEEGNAILLAVAAERRAVGDEWAAERCERYAAAPPRIRETQPLSARED